MYPYQSSIYLNQVALNISSLEKGLLFYRDVLGMTVLEQSNSHILLGTEKEALVELIPTTDTSVVKESYGLYHLAILVPSRQDLSDLLKRLIDLKIPLIGGADHGYSEAIYLEDFEGNGIELYRDKPVIEWDIREDGRIVGVTEELDATSLYETAQLLDSYNLPLGTRMGHVHLQVKNSKASSLFYQSLLNLDDKFSVPSGSWLASGDYHHHLAVNQWAGPNLDTRLPNRRGLAYYMVQVENKEDLVKIFENAQKLDAPSQWLSTNQLIIRDMDGIETRVQVKSLGKKS